MNNRFKLFGKKYRKNCVFTKNIFLGKSMLFNEKLFGKNIKRPGLPKIFFSTKIIRLLIENSFYFFEEKSIEKSSFTKKYFLNKNSYGFNETIWKNIGKNRV